MRRAGNLYDAIAEPENLRLAFWKASRGKRHRPDVAVFREQLGGALDRLRAELEAGRVRVGDYRYFVIRDPKERTICAAPFHERVLHHAIVNVCEPVFEAYQIHDSYACRPGKGVHAAVERARRFSRPDSWFVKLDARKYFDSVDHGVLLGLLDRRFKDRRLLNLLEQLVQTYETTPGRGLPIGNLTSQHFANHYLAALDHFVKEDLRVGRYLRYMDDLLLWSDDRGELKEWHRAVEAFAADRLRLELKPPVVGPCRRGVPALGYCVYPHTVRLLGRSKARFVKKLAACEQRLARGALTEAQAALRVQPLLGFVGHAATVGLRRRAIGAAPEARTG